MESTWRTDDRTTLTTDPVLRALLVSLLLHGILLGLSLMVQFVAIPLFPKLFALETVENLVAKTPPIVESQKEVEMMLTFVEVDPTQAVVEPPPDAKFYSSVSTEAANLAIQKESDMPNVEGKNRETLKLTENTQDRTAPLQPTPKAEKGEENSDSARPKETQEVGDLALAKPQEKARKDFGEADSEKGESETSKHERPRTLAEAKKRGLRGETSKVEGGVPKLAMNSLATRGTLLGDYDARLVDAVRQCWFDLLEPRDTKNPNPRRGKVVVEFHLHYDGRVSNVRTVENACGEMESLFCETAITKPEPFEKWPMELRRELKGDIREVRFTFHYE